MNHAAITRVFCAILMALGAAMAFTWVIAAIAGETAQMLSFGLGTGLCIALGFAGVILVGAPRREASINDGLATIILFWIIIPLPAALPFVFGVAEDSVIDAWHEAVSCLTTSGQSVVDIANDAWPDSLLVWRALLHIIGAVAGLTMVLSVFSAMNLDGPGVHRSIFFTLPDGSFFDGTPRLIRISLLLIMIISSILFLLLLVEGRQPELAIADALSVATTGLILPNQTSVDGPYGFGALILAVGLISTASGVAVLVNLRAQRWRAALLDPEVILLLFLIGAIGVVAWFAGAGLISGTGWAVSALATSGLSLGTPTTTLINSLPISVLILPAIIGGSALSTAGGIKLARIFILWRRSVQEFERLGFRNSVVALTYRYRAQDESEIIGIWVYVIAYIAAMTALFLVLSFLGNEFALSLADSVGAISNSGWLIDPDVERGQGHTLSLIGAMILGRLEVLALIPALSPSFWQR